MLVRGDVEEEVCAAGSAELAKGHEVGVRLGAVVRLEKPFMSERVTDFGGEVVGLSRAAGGGDVVPGVVGVGGGGLGTFDGEDVGRPGVVDDELGTVGDPLVHDDQGVGLEFGDLIILRDSAIGAEHTGNVDPDLGEFSILRQEFFKLSHLEVAVLLGGIAGRRVLARGLRARVTEEGHRGGDGAEFMVVVPRAVIDGREDGMLVARFDELLHDVDFDGRVADVVVGLLGRPEAEAGDMLDGEDGVFHPRVAGDLDPLVDIELIRGEQFEGGRAGRALDAVVGGHAVVEEHAVGKAFVGVEFFEGKALVTGRRCVGHGETIKDEGGRMKDEVKQEAGKSGRTGREGEWELDRRMGTELDVRLADYA